VGSIYLIRHGQASFGSDDYDVLSPVGVQQAEVLGRHLAALGINLQRCLSGDLRRQQHTAQAAMAQLAACGAQCPALEIDAAFNEFDADAVIRQLLPDLLRDEPHALAVMRNPAAQRAEFQRLFAQIIQRWVDQSTDSDSVESWTAFCDKVCEGLQRVLAQADKRDNIALFTSGGTITALLHRFAGIPAARAFDMNWQIVNTSLSCLKFRGDQVNLASFNSHAHLQLLKAPELITYR
jgi:broad specificity phosphatase PhoE